ETKVPVERCEVAPTPLVLAEKLHKKAGHWGAGRRTDADVLEKLRDSLNLSGKRKMNMS
ncbi:unnamed protein product, partial [Effrenium voratum]